MCSSFLRLVKSLGLFLLERPIFVDHRGFGHRAFAGFRAAKNEIVLVPSFEVETSTVSGWGTWLLNY
jgi:hypothetical protein